MLNTRNLAAGLLVAAGVSMFAGNALANNKSGASVPAVAVPKTVNAPEMNHDLFPAGISRSNAQAAWQQFNSRTFVDPNLRKIMSAQANVSTYNPQAYRVLGYGRASAGTNNSSVLNDGQVVPARESARCYVGARVLIVMHKVTGKRLEICTACGNPRLRAIIQRIPQRPWAIGTVLPFNKRVAKPITCPNGKKIGNVTIVLKGVATGRTWGKVRGSMTAQMRLQLKLTLEAVVRVKCGVSAPPPPAAPGPCSAVVNNSPGAVVTTCPTTITVVVVVCGQAQVFSGVNAQDIQTKIGQYQTQNCPVVTPPPVVPPPPPTVCPPGTVGTPPYCKTSPPGTFTKVGAVTITVQQSIPGACPPPNQSIIKTGTSDPLSLTSPTFTGSSTSSQAAADQDWINQINAWKTINQPLLDAQAKAQAQQRLGDALKTCPPPPPTYSASCSGGQVKDTNITWTVSGSASNGASVSGAMWTFSVGGSASGTTVTVNHGTYDTDVNANVTVTFSDGGTASTSCSQRTASKPPPPLP